MSNIYCGGGRFYRARVWGMYFARIFRIFCGFSCLLSTAYCFVFEIVSRLTFPFKITIKLKRKVVISINMAVHEKLFVDSDLYMESSLGESRRGKYRVRGIAPKGPRTHRRIESVNENIPSLLELSEYRSVSNVCSKSKAQSKSKRDAF